MNKNKTYWKIILLVNQGEIYARIASMLTGVPYHDILKDCNSKGKFDNSKVITIKQLLERADSLNKMQFNTKLIKLQKRKDKLSEQLILIDSKINELNDKAHDI